MSYVSCKPVQSADHEIVKTLDYYAGYDTRQAELKFLHFNNNSV